MDWIPIVFVIFKFLVLGTGMYYAIKWHYDQGKKVSVNERRAVLHAGGKVVVIFLLGLMVVGLATFLMIRVMGMELSFS